MKYKEKSQLVKDLNLYSDPEYVYKLQKKRGVYNNVTKHCVIDRGLPTERIKGASVSYGLAYAVEVVLPNLKKEANRKSGKTDKE